MTRLGALTTAEVGDDRVLLLPLGSTEQHGPHLPLDTDTVIDVSPAANPDFKYTPDPEPTALHPDESPSTVIVAAPVTAAPLLSRTNNCTEPVVGAATIGTVNAFDEPDNDGTDTLFVTYPSATTTAV